MQSVEAMSTITCLAVLTTLSVMVSGQYYHQAASFRFGRAVYEFRVMRAAGDAPQVLGKLDIIRSETAQTNSAASTSPLELVEVVVNSTTTYVKIDPRTLDVRWSGTADHAEPTRLVRQRNVHLRVLLMDRYRRPSDVLDACLVLVRLVETPSRVRPGVRFSRNPYEAQIYENNAPDTFLVRVDATVDDWDNTNASLTYQLVSTDDSKPSSLFYVKADTGELYARRALDREQVEVHVVHVMATSKLAGSERVRVVVRVLPAPSTSYRPMFDRAVYNVSLAVDNTDFVRRPMVVRVHAFDSDISNG